MRSVGVDIASAGFSAMALAIDGVPKRGVLWKPDKKDSASVRLDGFAKWMQFNLGLMKPDIVAVEELAVFMSKTVIRALARTEGVALLVAKRHGSIVVNPPVTQARSIVFKGQGVRSKEDSWQAFQRKFPDFKLPAANQGGLDICDAMIHALAGPVILERRR